MNPLNWKRLQAGKEHWMSVTDVPGAEYWITSPPRDGCVNIQYKCSMPGVCDKDSRAAHSERMKELTVKDWEWQRLFSYSHNQEVALAWSVDSARELIDRLRKGSESLPDAATTLLTRFEPYTALNSEDRQAYKLALKKGTITVMVTDRPGHTVNLTLRYDSKNSRWSHPMVVIYGDDQSYDKSSTCYKFFPEGCDPIKVAAAFVVEVAVPWIENNRVDLLDKKRGY